MRIAIISSTKVLTTGAGTSYTVTSIATYLTKKGLSTSVLSVSEKEEKYSDAGIEYMFFKENKLPGFSFSLLKYILNSDFDRYVFVGPTLPATLILWIKHKKIFWIPQWHKSYIFKNKFRSLLYHFLRLFDYIIASIIRPQIVCYTSEEFTHFRKSSRGTILIPLGLDFNRPLWKFFEGLEETKKVLSPNLLFVGRIVDHKFPLFMIEVIKHCKQKFENGFVLNAVGPIDKKYFSELNNSLESSSLKNLISFKGEVTEASLASFYKDADVFVFPSFSESFGYTIVEALYAGLPVVATRTGIVPLLEKQGLLSAVEFGDAETMANKIFDSYLHSDSIKRKLADQRMVFAKSFSLENFLDSLYGILV